MIKLHRLLASLKLSFVGQETGARGGHQLQNFLDETDKLDSFQSAFWPALGIKIKRPWSTTGGES